MVNVNDFVESVDVDNKLLRIFEIQKGLMSKYHEIEKANGFYVPKEIPVNLNDRFDQAKIKDFAWRIVEELGEALEAEMKGEFGHTDEEIADGFHFLVEASIMVGYTPPMLLEDLFKLYSVEKDPAFNIRSTATMAFRVGEFVEAIGKACNTLKNKPWKQTHMLTDTEYFKYLWAGVWEAYVALVDSMGITPYQMWDLYFRKSRVNNFRQGSGY